MILIHQAPVRGHVHEFKEAKFLSRCCVWVVRCPAAGSRSSLHISAVVQAGSIESRSNDKSHVAHFFSWYRFTVYCIYIFIFIFANRGRVSQNDEKKRWSSLLILGKCIKSITIRNFKNIENIMKVNWLYQFTKSVESNQLTLLSINKIDKSINTSLKILNKCSNISLSRFLHLYKN